MSCQPNEGQQSQASKVFFTSKLQNHFTSISELISFVCDCCRQGQCLLVCLSSMETVIKPATKPHLGSAAVLGLLPVEPQRGLGWREP